MTDQITLEFEAGAVDEVAPARKGSKKKPPHFREASGPEAQKDRVCSACTHYAPKKDLCAKFNWPVDQDDVCDDWERWVDEAGLDEARSRPGDVKAAGWTLRYMPRSHGTKGLSPVRVEAISPLGRSSAYSHKSKKWQRVGTPGAHYNSSYFKEQTADDLDIPTAVSKRAIGMAKSKSDESIDVDGFLDGQDDLDLTFAVLADCDERTVSGMVGGFRSGGPGGGPPLNSPHTLKGKKKSPKPPVNVGSVPDVTESDHIKIRLRTSKVSPGVEMLVRQHQGRMGTVDGHTLPVFFKKDADRDAFLASVKTQNDRSESVDDYVDVCEDIMVIAGLAISTFIGIPVGKGVVKTLRLIKTLLNTGKESAAEKAWARIAVKDKKAVMRWAMKHNDGKRPKGWKESVTDVFVEAAQIERFLSLATTLGLDDFTEAENVEGGLLVALESELALAVSDALGGQP